MQCAAVKTCLTVIRVPPHLKGDDDSSSSYPISAIQGHDPLLLTSPPTIFLNELILWPQPSSTVGIRRGTVLDGVGDITKGFGVVCCDEEGQQII